MFATRLEHHPIMFLSNRKQCGMRLQETGNVAKCVCMYVCVPGNGHVAKHVSESTGKTAVVVYHSLTKPQGLHTQDRPPKNADKNMPIIYIYIYIYIHNH